MIIDSPIISGSYLSTGSLSQTGNVSITGSLTVTQGITGSFSGSGADLFGIPATGITGLNLSQISSGSVSASISPNQGLLINTSVSASNFTGSFTGSLTGIATSASYASFALTSSYSLGGSGFPFSGSAVITGSLVVSGSGLTITGSVAISTLTTGSGVRYVLADQNGLLSAQTASAAIFTTQQVVSTSGQTVFPITNGYSTGYVTVFVNGTKLSADEYVDTSGTNIIFLTGSTAGDTVEFQKYLPAAGVSNNTLRTVNYFTATTGQTNFTVNYTPGLLDVFYNGAKLDNIEYTAANGTSITLATASAAGDRLEVDVYSYQVGAFSGIGGTGAANQLAYFNTTNSITGSNAFTVSGSAIIITGSLIVSGSGTLINIGPTVFSGSVTSTAGFSGSFSGNADSATTASYAYTASSATNAFNSISASYAYTASSAINAFSASKAISASYSDTSSYANNFTVMGNLTVYGTQSVQYITSSQLNISSNIITVNVGTPAIRFGGISVYDSGSTAGATGSLFWDSQNNNWVYQQVTGSTYTGGMLISGPRNTGGLGNEQGTTSGSLMKGMGGDHITSSAIFEDGYKATIYTNALVVSSSGLVGIGTTNPTVNLQVQGTTYPEIRITDGTIGYQMYSSTGASDFVVGTYTNHNLIFRTNAVQRLSIASTGATTFSSTVAIGGTNDGAGTLYVTASASTNAARLRNNDASYGTLDILNSNATGIGIYAVANKHYFSGSVGIGITNPATPLQILKDTNTNGTSIEESNMAFTVLSATGQSKIAIGACNAGNYGYVQVMQDATSWTTRNLTLQPRGGNVGIGTISPSYKFELAGSLGNFQLASSGAEMFFTRNENNDILATGGSSSKIRVGAQSQVVIGVGANYEARMTVTSGGNVEIGNGALFTSAGSGTSYSSKLWTEYSYPYIDTFLDSIAGTSYQSRLRFRLNGGAGAMEDKLILWYNGASTFSGLAGSGTRSVSALSDGTLTVSSDSSLKQEDTTHRIEGLAEILQLQPKAYKWINDIETRGEAATTEIGFFANDVASIIPSAAPKNHDNVYGFNDRAVIAALVKAIQEQNVLIQELQEKLQRNNIN